MTAYKRCRNSTPQMLFTNSQFQNCCQYCGTWCWRLPDSTHNKLVYDSTVVWPKLPFLTQQDTRCSIKRCLRSFTYCRLPWSIWNSQDSSKFLQCWSWQTRACCRSLLLSACIAKDCHGWQASHRRSSLVSKTIFLTMPISSLQDSSIKME